MGDSKTDKQSFPLDDVLDCAYDLYKGMNLYDRVGVTLIEDGRKLRCRWMRSNAKDIKLPLGYSSSLENTSLGRLIITRQPRILSDLEAYLRAHPGSDSTRRLVEEGLRSSLTFPLVASGEVSGFVFFSSMTPNFYSDVRMDAFQTITRLISKIVEKATMIEGRWATEEQKTRFLGIASHDLKSPLTIIGSYVDLLLDGLAGELTAQQKVSLGVINGASDQMKSLINDFLDISAIESQKLPMKRRAVDLAALLKAAAKSFVVSATSKSVTLACGCFGHLPPVYVDPHRIEQVINNLLSNAIKFSSAGTTITLRAIPTDHQVRISVADQGCGIPKKELNTLFTPYATHHHSTDGHSMGLGLAICRYIIDAHGGKIWVESELHRGSVFSFTLPVQGREIYARVNDQLERMSLTISGK